MILNQMVEGNIMACEITPFISLFLCPHLVLCPSNFNSCLSNILLHVKEDPSSAARPEARRPNWSFVRRCSQSLDRYVDNSIRYRSQNCPLIVESECVVTITKVGWTAVWNAGQPGSSGSLVCSPEKELH